jgi:hypothetical protein
MIITTSKKFLSPAKKKYFGIQRRITTLVKLGLDKINLMLANPNTPQSDFEPLWAAKRRLQRSNKKAFNLKKHTANGE